MSEREAEYEYKIQVRLKRGICICIVLACLMHRGVSHENTPDNPSSRPDASVSSLFLWHLLWALISEFLKLGCVPWVTVVRGSQRINRLIFLAAIIMFLYLKTGL
ncbi:hypothetical protein HYPSUDRAFT_1039658 [Hypholoma sublateritium FD-334 SS-4]|uniref:Uncharacterized protein n=1 Tax=Hypholoma sublateritium (strain FD-334 SS-4) TaxID=945553 RepID=A0A0D2PEG5_HYPSF|nr:hypothetical protein HYPSUDRAFT_1039658 [Hypholoma sublateritium FD-334 SS-4]